ncbi:MAG: hypothetical protein Q9203_005143 [Teloschistes exilis]
MSIIVLKGRAELKYESPLGPVVRVAPNELSFSTAQSWKDIYGQRKSHATFVKGDFYDGGNFANQAHSVVSERDPAKHAEMRRYLSSAFSDRSLKEQEYLVSGIIDNFISQIEKRASSPAGVNMTLWFNLMTFDIIGKLAFGQDFGGVDSGGFSFSNFEIIVISDIYRNGAQLGFDGAGKYGPVKLGRHPEAVPSLRSHLDAFESKLAEDAGRRIRTARELHYRVNQEVRSAYVPKTNEVTKAGVIAGSETTATTLTVVTYFLCHHPQVLKKLQTEVRGAFTKYEEISGASAANLKYLHAVCLEALRIFPPLPLALPRVVPSGGDTVDGHFVPPGVSPIFAERSSLMIDLRIVMVDCCSDESFCRQYVGLKLS